MVVLMKEVVTWQLAGTPGLAEPAAAGAAQSALVPVLARPALKCGVNDMHAVWLLIAFHAVPIHRSHNQIS